METNQTLDHIPALDGVRGAAVLLITWYHYATIAVLALNFTGKEWFYPAFKILTLGYLGVNLFFVLSGFLITLILLKNITAINYLSVFYGRRILRIFPIYYGILFVYFIVAPLIQGNIASSTVVHHQLHLWTYTTNLAYPNITFGDLNHLWSLAVEEHFYLLWPILIKFFYKKDMLIPFCISLIIISMLSKIIMTLLSFDSGFIYEFSLNSFDSLALGSLIAIFNGLNKLPAILSKKNINKTFFTFACLAILDSVSFFKFSHQIAYHFQCFIMLLFFSILIQYVYIFNKGIVFKIFASKILRWFGLYSYGIYIFHLPVQRICSLFYIKFDILNLLNNYRLSKIEKAFVWSFFSFIITLIISYLSYNYYEKKLLHFKKYFKYYIT